MSGVAAFLTNDAIHVATDTAGIAPDKTLFGHTTKFAVAPHCDCAIFVRGTIGAIAVAGARILTKSSFREMKGSGFDELIVQFREAVGTPLEAMLQIPVEFFLAGFDEGKPRFVHVKIYRDDYGKTLAQLT